MVRKATSLTNSSKHEVIENEEKNTTPQSDINIDLKIEEKSGVSKSRSKKISKKNPPKNQISKNKKYDSLANNLDTNDLKTMKHTIEQKEFICETHQEQKVDFFCQNRGCLRELCSFCILEHKDHINEIFPIRDLIKANLEFFSNSYLEEIQNNLLYNQTKSLREFEILAEKLKNILFEKINAFKEILLQQDQTISESLNQLTSFKKLFNLYESKIRKSKTDDKNLIITPEAVSLLKDCIKSQEKNLSNGYCIEEDIIIEEFARILSNNISFIIGNQSFNSVNQNVPKILHWFEWEKRELHLFDVVHYRYKSIKLIIPFKIPPFSRSIIAPEGKIFLVGGEDPEHGAKKEVYAFNLVTHETDHSLHPRCPMPFKKYDFTMCYHKGFIYTICGKDSESQVVDSCEKYDINRNQWFLAAPINNRRYAASAVVAKEIDRIYLFGGRSDQHNMMMNGIEEFDISKNIWRVVQLKMPQEWIPVEVCSTIQIGPGRILIFGGSDASIEDSKNSYLFHVEDYRLEKTAPLNKAHVFVAAPFLHGNNVFAVGNEYYVKSRNIHRFNIEKLEWEIVF